jgi:hypothetical protein
MEYDEIHDDCQAAPRPTVQTQREGHGRFIDLATPNQPAATVLTNTEYTAAARSCDYSLRSAVATCGLVDVFHAGSFILQAGITMLAHVQKLRPEAIENVYQAHNTIHAADGFATSISELQCSNLLALRQWVVDQVEARVDMTHAMSNQMALTDLVRHVEYKGDKSRPNILTGISSRNSMRRTGQAGIVPYECTVHCSQYQ